MMSIDWKKVKKQTLWSYEDLIHKLRSVLAYDFVRKYYNHSMKQAQEYALKIQRGYLQNRGEKTAWINSLVSSFAALEARRVGTYSTLVNRVATREDCLAFLQHTDFDFDQLIQTLSYLLRWVLPFKTSLREVVGGDDSEDAIYLDALREQMVRSNLDLLEVGRTKPGRIRLSRTAGIPEARITALVLRADITRLAYVRGKTVKHLCAGGYDSLVKIAAADLAQMEEDMDAYYRTLGKSPANFRSVVPLSWILGGAKILPRVVRL
jgi:hypothetical protein